MMPSVVYEPASPSERRKLDLVKWEGEPPLETTAAPTDVPSELSARPTKARRVLDVVKVPPLPAPRERFELLQQFEGTVLDVVEESGEFQARYSDLTRPTNPDETAWFALEDVSDDDLPLVVPGAVFYWQIGYRVRETGAKERSSSLRFRRLPAWTRADLARARERADRWELLLGTDESK